MSKVIRRRNYRKMWLIGIMVFVAVSLFTFLAQNAQKEKDDVFAANLANFDAGYIISDYQMGNYNSMTEAQIQSFLDSKINCNKGKSYYDYLVRTYPGFSWNFNGDHIVCLNEERFGDGEVIGTGDSAAHIIWQAAQDYRINPQVLIVLLQKEQGLITDAYPNTRQYRAATGYGCPDTAPCASEYYGFKNQVRKAAAMFRTVLDGGWTNYPLGDNWVRYSDKCSSGSTVNIKNLATSALYRYTPYQPNAAALAAGYSSVPGNPYETCAAYGNRNFYLYFEDWFGGIWDEGGIVELFANDDDIDRIDIRKTELSESGFDIGDRVGEIFCYRRSGDDKRYCVQRFRNGYIISSPKGAWESYGKIRQRWGQLEYENGLLGYPNGGVECYEKKGQIYCVQRYDNGYIISGPKGAWESYGAIRQRWAELGYENGVLGYPIDEVYCYKNTKNLNDYCVQRYDNGYIISGPKGAWESYGAIRQRWADTDYERGNYGYPCGAVIIQEDMISQDYDGGVITVIGGTN